MGWHSNDAPFVSKRLTNEGWPVCAARERGVSRNLFRLSRSAPLSIRRAVRCLCCLPLQQPSAKSMSIDCRD
jgi:hypothetical protein